VALRQVFRLCGAVSPAAAARLAGYLWFRPPRNKPPAGEQAVLQRARHSFMEHDSKRIAVYHWGHGPVVLLVHGWSGRAAQLGAMVEPLVAAGYGVVAFDAPAHGRSEGTRTTLPEISAAILKLVADSQPVHAVIAHSFGVPATLLALQQRPFAQRVVSLSAPASLGGIMERFQEMLGLSPRTGQLLRERLMRRFGDDMMARFSAENMARSMNLPALIIHDRDDRDIPWQDGEDLARAWPRAQFVSTSGLGHRRILRDPEVIDRVVQFLSRAAVPAAATAAARRHHWDSTPAPAGRPR